jgi:hypothetical protein
LEKLRIVPISLTKIFEEGLALEEVRPMLVGDGTTLAGERSAKMLAEMRATGWWPEILISIMGVITSTELPHWPAAHEASLDRAYRPLDDPVAATPEKSSAATISVHG